MGQGLNQASRLGPKDNTASESSQVTYTSITSNPSTSRRPAQQESISITAAGHGSSVSAAARSGYIAGACHQERSADDS